MNAEKSLICMRIYIINNIICMHEKNWRLRIETGGSGGGSLLPAGRAAESEGRSSKDALVSCIKFIYI